MPSTPYGIELNRLAALWAEQPTNTCFAALAEALRKRGALVDAAAVAAAGVAAQPDYLPGHVVRARILCDQHQWEAAEAELRAALLLDATHPVVLDARAALERQVAFAAPDAPTGGPAAGEPDDNLIDDMVYPDDESGATTLPSDAEPVLTESLAMLYRGQGHLARAVEVLDALVARTPDNAQLVARRDAVRAELDNASPRRYDGSGVGGRPVRQWLSSVATAAVRSAPPASSLDAFFQVTTAPTSEAGDLAAFQAWLRELDR